MNGFSCFSAKKFPCSNVLRKKKTGSEKNTENGPKLFHFFYSFKFREFALNANVISDIFI